MPKAQDAANWTNPPLFKRPAGVEGPLVSTLVGKRDGSRPVDEPFPQGTIFSENFDDLPDTTSADGITSALMDVGWTHSYNSGDGGGPHYTPDQGYPDNHHLWEITGENTSSGAGKSINFYRESWRQAGGESGWNSDGQLYKALGRDYNELFIRFWMRFQTGWTPSGQSKLFRVLHYDGDGGRFDFFEDGKSAPILFWDYGYNQYGLRNFLAFRGDPQETSPTASNYYFSEQTIPNLPRPLGYPSDLSLNFDYDVRDLNGDGTDDNPMLMTDLLTGEPLEPGTITHDQVYGDKWFKVEFYVKMNSSASAEDGVMKQWIRDQLVFSNETIPWIGPGGEEGIGWNAFAFGGNDNWNSYPNEQAVQEHYSVDNIEVYDYLPEEKR